MIYLDHNPTIPVVPEVLETMMPFFREERGNPSSSYRFGSRLKKVIETAREQVAVLIGAHPLEILFTSGGTESVPLVAGLGMAVDIARKKSPAFEGKVRPLRDALENGILTAIPQTELNGHPALRLAKTTNITFHGIESEALLLLLDQAGICASSGSACLADSPDPSHVVAAMKPGSAARQCVRFSLGVENAKAQIREALNTIRSSAAMLGNAG
ncbi:MAG: aminotransferase class V-fold PLP-dependent enzyme [Terrimicrobiaceae bacterium]